MDGTSHFPLEKVVDIDVNCGRGFFQRNSQVGSTVLYSVHEITSQVVVIAWPSRGYDEYKRLWMKSGLCVEDVALWGSGAVTQLFLLPR